MSLFPAYAEGVSSEDAQLQNAEKRLSSRDITEAMEVELLASDTEDEVVPHTTKQSLQPTLHSEDFYLDSKVDYGNLHVSTLYYPGRPQYSYTNSFTIGSKHSKKDEKKRWKRYFSKVITDECDSSIADRLIAYRKLLSETPDDLQLWEAYIDFREVCENEEGALEAAREASRSLPDSARLRLRVLDLMQTVLPHRRYSEELRAALDQERRPSVRTELWARLVGAAATEAEATATAQAALADCRRYAPATLRLLLAFGLWLRTAGLWERLVLAVELLVAMNLPTPSFPPPPPADAAAAERRLLDLEDEAVGSGLPAGVVWTRVERARGAALWRPAPLSSDCADPQRAPLPADVADLLLPVVGDDAVAGLAVRLLLLAKVPFLPATEAAARALGERDGSAEALLALVAERRPTPADEASVAPALEALVDPPHYFADDTGFGSWVSALWDACCSACGGERREALVCWRLRWLRALLLAAPPERRAERAALLRRARGVLKRLAPTSPLAFAEFALLEASAARAEGGEGDAERAKAAVAHALRAALADAHAPPEHALYVARVVGEVSGAEAGESATVSAVLRRPPPHTLTFSPPDAASKAAALAECEERCAELERRPSAADEEDVTSFLRPSAAEWARARLALASAARRRELLARLLRAADADADGAALRFLEASASELALRGAAAGAELRLARLFPGNAFLNLASASARAPSVQRQLSAVAPPRSPTAALASLLAPFLRAWRRDWPPVETARAVRAARRATSGAGGAACGGAAWAARLEAEARAADPRPKRALLAALQLTPHDKWLHVRGARVCGEEAAALADALLERQLRLHALPDELRAPDR